LFRGTKPKAFASALTVQSLRSFVSTLAAPSVAWYVVVEYNTANIVITTVVSRRSDKKIPAEYSFLVFYVLP
jgi:hypothetical protein